MGTPKGSLACRCRSLLNTVLSNAVGAKTMRRRPVAPKHDLAVCGSGERTRVAPRSHFMAGKAR